MLTEGETSRASQRGERPSTSALSVTDQDYLKQAFCGFLKAKEAVEMEHLGASLLIDVFSISCINYYGLTAVPHTCC